MKRGKIFIGTSGWNYKHWIGRFYPEETKQDAQLQYYQQFFNTVELNNSFYHLPAADTFKHWKRATPKDFVFTVKASRYITHMKKLKDAGDALDTFLGNAHSLGKKLGPILFQLPPGWKLNEERLQDFLKQLPKKNRFVFEFRNPTWYAESVNEILQKHNCAFCIYELAGHLSPVQITADFVYTRLHGPGDRYQGSYTTAALKKWAKKIHAWSTEGKDVYMYFDNDQNAYAAFNAQKIKELVDTLSS
jgi:uncharacterized protein YecE (DUF72 family)